MLYTEDRQFKVLDSLIGRELELRERFNVHTPKIPDDKRHLFTEITEGLEVLTGEKAGVVV
ncbi:hypothetical protein MK805_05730 [Shimazuella sp. AN120528]|uniref:hypothetical protein n=1 Tax=Shimazuella soli TaxID=1892854 RepID=UPI001F0E04E9|nr:hypothetical protein [Shimazuella soli]MCH5584467.1 hypothetical protein [Shimazuella soli]